MTSLPPGVLLINTSWRSDKIVAACDGDLRGALRALMLLNEQLRGSIHYCRSMIASMRYNRPSRI
ncbi:hypothetical protein XH94_06785 [Bradyrhizobium zhanjiangense]|uniref:Uncharacterized protein n=1 Tax=Bradyrhizobium zhanjiangense TaxID=1325107 RepID=A0A4Q0SSI2_9BRAD|nr:hypothetical protein [Bradyrhizobium zhanjiangense]RXH41678.1 hypothetical protein XH94_06785 [Bradyrhizobium zhanjiangense]